MKYLGGKQRLGKYIAPVLLDIWDYDDSLDGYMEPFCGSLGVLKNVANDDSMKKVLNAKKDIKDVKANGIYNPMESILSDQGIGSNAYRDVWQLFDQILVTEPLLNKKYDSYQFYKAGVFNKSYLINKSGRYKGYPFRSFSWGSFTGGYSDHLPSYIYLIKEIN